MEKVLITGGGGFIGYHLSYELLKNGSHVTIVDNFSRAVEDRDLDELKKNKNLDIKKVDILNLPNLLSLGSDYTHIFHLAAIIGVQHVLKRPYDVLNLNTLMLSNIIEFSKQQKGLQRLVFSSTSEIYAGTLSAHGLDFPTKEATNLTVSDLNQPRTSYMLSKIYGEAMCIHSGLPATIIRPHNFYGPRMGLSHVIPELLNKANTAANGDSLEVFSVDHKRTFCFIDDAIGYIIDLSKSSKTVGQAYNVGVEKPEYSIGQLAEVITAVTEKKMKIVPKDPSPGSPVRRCPSMEKVHATVAYRAKFDLEEGVSKTYRWYKNNVFGGGVSAI